MDAFGTVRIQAAPDHWMIDGPIVLAGLVLTAIVGRGRRRSRHSFNSNVSVRLNIVGMHLMVVVSMVFCPRLTSSFK